MILKTITAAAGTMKEKISRIARRQGRTGAIPNKRRLRELSVLFGLVLAIFITEFAGFAADCADVRADTLRLHILANSDTKEDQALKLAVRDEILRTYGKDFQKLPAKHDAVNAVRQRLEGIRSTAQRTVQRSGYNYPVSVRLENCYFATRDYGAFILPAGRYDALRVEIGNHEGRNWFCVMFPPMCLPAAEKLPEELSAYTQAERAVLTEKRELRFAAVEWFERCREYFAEKKKARGDAHGGTK